MTERTQVNQGDQILRQISSVQVQKSSSSTVAEPDKRKLKPPSFTAGNVAPTTRRTETSASHTTASKRTFTSERSMLRGLSRNVWIRRISKLAFGIGLLQLLVLLALCSTTIQRHLLYLHRLRLPINADFDSPEMYGLAPFKTRNLQIRTADGETIGAWHVLPQPYYETAHGSSESRTEGLERQDPSAAGRIFPPLEAFSNQTFERAFRKHCTVIYFHGNAASRAMSHRVRAASDFSRFLECNVLAIDYRGYGDSTGTPSEAGLLQDAIAAWNYVSSRTGVEQESPANSDDRINSISSCAGEITLVGHSLGTGVAAKLAGYLSARDIHPKAIILIAPFFNIPELLTTYNLLGVPLLSHFRTIPYLQKLLLRFLSDTWASDHHLVKTKSPVLLLHAEDDHDIPIQHSERLFHLLARTRSLDPGALAVSMTRPGGWGVVREARLTDHERTVIWFAGASGGHNAIGNGEGVLELMRIIMHKPSIL